MVIQEKLSRYDLEALHNMHKCAIGAIKVGSVVRLLSGGPLMTVLAMAEITAGETQYVDCVWFGNGDKAQSESFPIGILKVTDDA
jgi:uncharacterized protein YodC (DUF2158 family)